MLSIARDGAAVHPADRRTHRADRALLAIVVATLSLVSGCAGWFDPFVEGTYSADLPCEIQVVDPSGQEAGDSFTHAATLTVRADGDFAIDGAPLVVGQEVVRSIPTADLAFEITEVRRFAGILTVEYAPRPSLPGITIDGDLVESYRWRGGTIAVDAESNLRVTDVSGTSSFTATCTGLLTK